MRERTPLTRGLLERLPRLKLIASTGFINATIDVQAARELGIAVAHTGYDLTPTIEMTWALILASGRHVPAESASLRSGGWQRSIGNDLKGKTLGVLGLGNIGGEVARVGHAFGMRVIAWSENLTAEKAAAVGAEHVQKNELFRQSDVLTIHLILSRRSRRLVGAAELALMKSTAWLVNTSRGPDRRRERLDRCLARTSNCRRRRRCLRRRAAAGRSSLPVARRYARDTAHRLCVSESLSNLLWRYGQEHHCLVGWFSISSRGVSSDLPRKP